jgi:hypothetical protein
MKVQKTIILEDVDYYEAIKDYLKKKLNIRPEDVCSVAYRATSANQEGATMVVIISEENVP